MPQLPLPRVVNGLELCLPGHVCVCVRSWRGQWDSVSRGKNCVHGAQLEAWHEWGLSGQTASPYSAFMQMRQRYPLAQRSSPVSVVWQADGNLV